MTFFTDSWGTPLCAWCRWLKSPQHAILTTANGTLFSLGPQDGFIAIPIESTVKATLTACPADLAAWFRCQTAVSGCWNRPIGG